MKLLCLTAGFSELFNHRAPFCCAMWPVGSQFPSHRLNLGHGSENAESWPQDHQGTSQNFLFKKYLCKVKHFRKHGTEGYNKVQTCYINNFLISCLGYPTIPSVYNLRWLFLTFNFYIISNLEKRYSISAKTFHIFFYPNPSNAYPCIYLPT